MRISKFLREDKLKLIVRTFIESQFNYCPLLWIFDSRTLNNKINKLHKRVLRVVYKNDNLSFQQLLEKDNSIIIHDRKLQKFAVEMSNVNNLLSPLPVQDIFKRQGNTPDLRNDKCWKISRVRTVNNGIETIRYRGPKTWNPNEIKETKSLIEFKTKIKHWKPHRYTCRLCKVYISNFGFL